MNRRIQLRSVLRLASLLAVLAVSGCRADHVQVTIENHTGAPVKVLELDYPSASFGADQIATGADFHYRIQVRGSDQLKLSYTGADNRQYKIKGPELADHSQGRLEIVLLPGGQVEFHPTVRVVQ